MKSLYDLCKIFAVVDDNGDTYKNPYDSSFALDFVYNLSPIEYTLNQNDIDRIDLLMYRTYGSPEWDDIILFINNKSSTLELTVGDVIKLPQIKDLEAYYSSKVV